MLEQLNKDNFYQLLNRFNTAELETLIQKFPYFQQAHLLLAKKYQQENNPRFDEQLQMAALYTQNRELFYDIFHEQIKQEITVTAPAAEHEKFAEAVIEQQPVEIPAIQLTENPTVVEEIHPEQSEVETPAKETLETVSHIEAVEQPIEIVTAPTVEEETVAIEEETEVQETTLAEATGEAEKQQREEEITLNEPHTFTEWLHAFPIKSAVKEAAEILENETIEEDDLNKIILENANIDYLHTLVEEETHYSKGLDKFINEQKQKRSKKAEKPEKQDQLDPDLITETLAGLYAAQRKYSKAIKAYELLSLKFPEKSDLFAARIQYLKKLI